jgi:glycerophosphoryl diester phosphodiesterase
VAVPTLDELLALVRDTGVTIALDIKRASSRDTTTVPAVAEAVNRSGMPLDRVIVGTYRARALAEIHALLPGAATAQGTLRRDNERGLRLATPGQWFGPQWPVSRDFVGRAHALGLRVVPYTLNTGAQMRAAAAARVDAFLTDDPVKAVRVLRSPS